MVYPLASQSLLGPLGLNSPPPPYILWGPGLCSLLDCSWITAVPIISFNLWSAPAVPQVNSWKAGTSPPPGVPGPSLGYLCWVSTTAPDTTGQSAVFSQVILR